eukprot:198769_1
MRSFNLKTIQQFCITTQRSSKIPNPINVFKSYASTSVVHHHDKDDEINIDDCGEVIDISEPICSSKTALNVTSKDYYTQYSKSFFKSSYQNMMKKVANADEFNPKVSMIRKFEKSSLIQIEPGVIKTPSSLLKIQLKVTKEHLADKKRFRLDEYLFRRLIFAVFHYTNTNTNNTDNIMDPIQLRFRLFDAKARKRARQTLRKFRAEKHEQQMVEKESIISPLTLTQMKLSRGMINRFTTEHGAIINDRIHIYRPSYKLKEHDQIVCYISYSFLLEQYHKRIAQLFMYTLRENKQQAFLNANNDSEMDINDTENDNDIDEQSDDENED